jgi:hypothetical protein
MVTFQWADPKFALHRLYKSCTIDNIDNPFYSFSDALHPLLAFFLACTFALYILAYPPKYKKLSIFLLAIPVAYAFYHHTEVAPNFTVCDTFGRFLYIWLAHMSLSVCIIEWSPPVTKDNPGTSKMRIRAAYKVLFCRSEHENVLNPAPKHGHSRTRFLAIHLWKACYLLVLQNAWSIFTYYYVRRDGVLWGPQYAIFFRRIPDSLDGEEMWERFCHFIYWCVINMWLYESYHSVFAILFVGLGFDRAEEWGMSLFGPVAEARTVRGYWGKHWHNYIYASFSGHTKILTRKWLGMRRGKMSTRLVENTIVFGASGVMHSLVRYMQDPNSGGYMVIALWYVGQMLPIIIEGVVMDIWKAKKKEYSVKQTKWLTACEYAIGFLWVVGFNMWSIPKYVHTRGAWAEEASRKKYAAQEAAWEKKKYAMEGKDEL